MPRYIDADALMQKYCNECGVKDREYFCRAHCGEKMIIENMPTADVEPVRHGRWIRMIGDDYECSECKAAVWSRPPYPTERYKYCWSCGAKMDGGKK